MTTLSAVSRSTVAGREAVARARAASRARPRRVTIMLAVALVVASCVSLGLGDYPIPLLDVVPAMFGTGNEGTALVVQELRLPRTLTGIVVGAGFGISGAIFQAVARNPLASPDILGVLLGSAAVAVLMITTVGSSFASLYAGAFCGAVGLALLIYLLAFRQGVSAYRFVLVGIGLGFMAGAVTSYLLTRADVYAAAAAAVWLTGSLNSTGWETVVPTALIVAALAPVTLMLASRLGALQLGDDTCRGLGVPIERSRLALLLVAVAMAGAGTAAAGPVAFVAFMAAPIARRLTRTSLTILPAALMGALLVTVSDLVGRRIFAPTEIPVGVITGIIGAPYLLWLLATANRIGRGG